MFEDLFDALSGDSRGFDHLLEAEGKRDALLQVLLGRGAFLEGPLLVCLDKVVVNEKERAKLHTGLRVWRLCSRRLCETCKSVLILELYAVEGWLTLLGRRQSDLDSWGCREDQDQQGRTHLFGLS